MVVLFPTAKKRRSMNSGALVNTARTDLAVDTSTFSTYLESLGLPTQNIIASSDQRRVVAQNLPSFIAALPPGERQNARYLSKFLGATAIGLFDAALNYIWNEVVLNLRKKAVVYGVDLFFDAAVGGKTREFYKTEDDLSGLKDSVLLDTCRKLELISDIVYRKLDHVLTMRNQVAASHPNVESIGGFELLGWLETCVKDVLQDPISESAIRIKALVENLKAATVIVDQNSVVRFSQEIKNLSLPHANNLLISLFGIYVASSTAQNLRKNIALLAPAIFSSAAEGTRNRIGIMIDGYRTNLEQDKLARAVEFLALVDGRRYESLSSRIVALDSIAERLMEAHVGWDNFYNEPPVMQEVLAFCKSSADIPLEVQAKLIRTVLSCRIGRGIPYCRGVSPGGQPLYDQFFSIFDDRCIAEAIVLLYRPEINAKLKNPICQQHLQAVLSILRGVAVAPRLQAALDLLLADIPGAAHANGSANFRELTSPFITWQQ